MNKLMRLNKRHEDSKGHVTSVMVLTKSGNTGIDLSNSLNASLHILITCGLTLLVTKVINYMLTISVSTTSGKGHFPSEMNQSMSQQVTVTEQSPSFGADVHQKATFEECNTRYDVCDSNISFRQEGRITDVKHK